MIVLHSPHDVHWQDFLGKSDPYLEFAKHNSDGSFTPVHTTEVCMCVCVWSLWRCGVCVTVGVVAGNQELSEPSVEAI